MTFVAQYGGPEGPRVEGQGSPFTATYLLPLAEKTGTAFRDCMSHLSGYVAHDLTTPLGPALEQIRRKPAAFGMSPFRGFGTYGVWFPRGLLLRAAAHRICRDLVARWKAEEPPAQSVPVDLLVAQAMGESRLKPDAVQAQIEREAVRGQEGGPADQIERWLTGLEGQIDAPSRRAESGAWAHNVWDQARDFIGTRPTNEQDSAVRRSRISRSLEEAIRRVSEMWGNEFTELTRPLEDDPGPRVATVELALRRVAGLCQDAAAALEKRLQQHGLKCRQARNDVQAALDACQAGSGTFSFFGGRSGRSMRHFLDQLRAFSRLRLQEDMTEGTAHFYRKLRDRVEHRLRDLAFCRARLEHLLQSLDSPLANLSHLAADTPFEQSEEALQQTLHPTNTLQVVLPAGDNHIDRSAAKVVRLVKADDVLRLEHALQKLVLEPRGGLTSLCQTNADLSRLLLAPMVEQTTAFLGDLLPITDVTEVEVSASRARKTEMADRIGEYHAKAAPQCGTQAADEQHARARPRQRFGQAVRAAGQADSAGRADDTRAGAGDRHDVPARARLPVAGTAAAAPGGLPAGLLRVDQQPGGVAARAVRRGGVDAVERVSDRKKCKGVKRVDWFFYGTSKTQRKNGPTIRIHCPGCGERDTPADTFEVVERIKLYLIPLPTQRERQVICRWCGAAWVTHLQLEELATLSADELITYLVPRVSIVVYFLAIASVLLFCMPVVGLVLGIAGLVGSWKSGGLAYRLSISGIVLTVLLWGGLFLRSAVLDLQK